MGDRTPFERYIKPADIVVYFGIILLAISLFILSYATSEAGGSDIFYSKISEFSIPMLGFSLKGSFFVFFIGLFVLNSLIYKHDREIWQEDRKELYKLKDETLPKINESIKLITEQYNTINIKLAEINAKIDTYHQLGGKKK